MEDINNTTTTNLPSPSNEDIYPQPANPKNIYKYLFFISIITLIGFIAYFVLNFKNKPPLVKNNSPDNISVASTIEPKPTTASLNEIFLGNGDKLFFSTVKDKSVNIFVYNPKTNKIAVSKTIELDDNISPFSTNTAFGSNDAVQYNPKTQDIFMLTYGSSAYDGSCINKDGTCVSRIYKIELNGSKPTVIFESETLPSNWIINSSDNSLLLSTIEGNIGNQTQIIKKISGLDGKVIFTKSYPILDGEGLQRFVISPDNRFTYQTSLKSTDHKVYDQVLTLHKIDNSNGDITYQEIFTGDEINEDTDLSPDNNYLAFYSKGKKQVNSLYVYEISTKKIKSFPVGQPSNVNIFWSGDSKKILFWNVNVLNYFSIQNNMANIVYSNFPKGDEILCWNSSTYFTFKSNKMINIFNTTNNKIINTSLNASSMITGMNWF